LNAAILTCSSLRCYVDKAQETEGTRWPVREVDRKYHGEPADMKVMVSEALEALPPEIDTVLVAMGFCGGVWDHVAFDRRIVIPRFDDCISILLNTDDAYHPNLKEPGHLYIYENEPEDFSALALLRTDYADSPDLAGVDRDTLFHLWFDNYRSMDIIDTGLNDCYSEAYVMAAQENADSIHAELGYVAGSYRVLEKLVGGRWDSQFLVAEPGQLLRHGDFFT